MSDSPGTAGRAPGGALTIATAPGDVLAFVPADPVVTTAGSIALSFRNGSTLAHNLVFTDGLSAATRAIVEPGTDDNLLLEPNGPGAYRFVCTIHDGMAGVLLVEAPAP